MKKFIRTISLIRLTIVNLRIRKLQKKREKITLSLLNRFTSHLDIPINDDISMRLDI